MKFLLNMNVARDIGALLAPEGHECRHVGDLGMARASDVMIVAEALRADEVILTHDLDYGQILAFSGAAGPSAVIFRLRPATSDLITRRLVDAWARIEAPLATGAIVVIEAGGVRIRSLPVDTRPG